MTACPGNRVFQDDPLCFLLLRRATADQNPDRLLEIEEPERHLQVIDIEHLGEIAERSPVLIMRI